MASAPFSVHMYRTKAIKDAVSLFWGLENLRLGCKAGTRHSQKLRSALLPAMGRGLPIKGHSKALIAICTGRGPILQAGFIMQGNPLPGSPGGLCSSLWPWANTEYCPWPEQGLQGLSHQTFLGPCLCGDPWVGPSVTALVALALHTMKQTEDETFTVCSLTLKNWS